MIFYIPFSSDDSQCPGGIHPEITIVLSALSTYQGFLKQRSIELPASTKANEAESQIVDRLIDSVQIAIDGRTQTTTSDN